MKTATIYGYHGTTAWRYVVEYRNNRLADLRGENGTHGKATLRAWLIINGFTHFKYGPHGGKQPCDKLN